MEYISPKKIQQTLVLLLMLIMGGLIFLEVLPYLSGVLGAITIYVLMHKWMIILVRKGWPAALTASFLMFLSFLISKLISKVGKNIQTLLHEEAL